LATRLIKTTTLRARKTSGKQSGSCLFNSNQKCASDWSILMATVKRGVLTKSGKWWKRLRWMKHHVWRAERQEGKRVASKDAAESRPVEMD
jgi:ABC-type antimicrobial peptide transport system ATPase subunit